MKIKGEMLIDLASRAVAIAALANRYSTAALVIPALLTMICGCGSEQPGSGPQEVGTASSGAASASSENSSLSMAVQLKAIEQLDGAPHLDTSASLMGPDSNSNGIRDDVESFINSLPDSSDQKKSLMQLSAALSATLTTGLSDMELEAAADKVNDSEACIWQQYDADSAQHKGQQIEALTINTLSRSTSYLIFNKAVGGFVFQMKKDTSCE